MLNGGVLKFDALGKVRNTNSAPVPSEYNAGVGLNQGLLSVDSTAPQYWTSGLPFTSSGQLSVQTTGTLAYYTQGGLPINENGCILADTESAVAYRQAGLPFTSGGKLALAEAEAPV